MLADMTPTVSTGSHKSNAYPMTVAAVHTAKIKGKTVAIVDGLSLPNTQRLTHVTFKVSAQAICTN